MAGNNWADSVNTTNSTSIPIQYLLTSFLFIKKNLQSCTFKHDLALFEVLEYSKYSRHLVKSLNFGGVLWEKLELKKLKLLINI